MKDTRKSTLLLAGVLGAFGAGLAAGKAIGRAARPGVTEGGLPRASLLDTLALGLEVFAPVVAQGVIIRRPPLVALAERFDLDRRAVRRLQKLRDRYGAGPLMLPLPLRKQAVLLDPGHVRRVLDASPEPFSAASTEKRAALSHFEPEGVLLSTGARRAERRRYNEAALDSAHPMHRLAARFLPLVEEEAARMLDGARERGALDWELYSQGWYRLVRRVVLGDGAAEDHALQDMLVRLRGAANWAGFHPRMRITRARFLTRIAAYLERAEPGSLAGHMATIPRSATTLPQQQVPQWLFAFDAAAIAGFRALALLASHPGHARHAQAEAATRALPQQEQGQPLPFLRACVLEALRLWPTTPMILRQSTAETRWDAGGARASMPADTGILIHAPFFHRDDARLPWADRFTPSLWLDDGARQDAPLVPFSDGPVTCPGRNLVLMLSSAMLGALVDGRRLALAPDSDPRLDPARLPGTLDNYRLRFRIAS